MHSMLAKLVLLEAASFSLAAFASAQNPATESSAAMAAALAPLPPGTFDRYLTGFEPLKFSGEVKALSLFASLGNSVFKPPGAGPFPAIVLTHSCGGVEVPQLRERAKELLEAGYLVLMLDSFKPRGQTNCRNGVVTSPLTSRDAVNALVHLQTLKEVDKSRIYQVGYSLGELFSFAPRKPFGQRLPEQHASLLLTQKKRGHQGPVMFGRPAAGDRLTSAA